MSKSVFLHFLSIVCLIRAQNIIENTIHEFFPQFTSTGSGSGSETNDVESFSTPEECARLCQDGESPKTCYYKFHIELYTTNGPACDKGDEVQCVMADGVERTVITINRQIPGPAIEVCAGDRLYIDVENDAAGIQNTFHWHGIHQKGSQYYDGVPFVTQCPILAGTTFGYQYKADNPGTHFYHTHTSSFTYDGMYGSLIVREPPSLDPHYNLYDVDNDTIILSDWLHELSLERVPGRYRNRTGQVGDNILINGRGNYVDPQTKESTNAGLAVFNVTQGERYRFRIINAFSSVCLAELSIEGHSCTLIAQDGANVKPKVVDTIITSSGERVDCIINANQPARSYWIQVRGLGECEERKIQQLGVLRYDDSPLPSSASAPTYDDAPSGIVYNPLSGSSCGTKDTAESVCVNQLESLNDDVVDTPADVTHIIPFKFFDYAELNNTRPFQGQTFDEYFIAIDRSILLSMMNNIVFKSPSSAAISQPDRVETCEPDKVSACTRPCRCTQTYHVKLGVVIDVMVYDEVPQPDLHHPFHLHGYEFQVLYIGQWSENTTVVSEEDINKVLDEHNQRIERGEYRNPPLKDNLKIPMAGYAIIRFKADNPGWWLFHCHFTWHHMTGMELIYHVGEQSDLPPVPADFPECYNWKPPVIPPLA